MSKRRQVLLDERELAAIRKASQHNFPSGEIEQMVAEIERGDSEEP